MEVQGLNLQLPFHRHGRRWIADRHVASLILQLTGNRDGIRRPEQGSDTSSYFRDRYSDVLRDSELAFEHGHLFFDGLQIQGLRTRIDGRRGFDSSGWVQHELNRFVPLDNWRVDVNAGWELNIHDEA